MSDHVQRTRFEHWLLGGTGVSARSVPELDGLRGIAVLMVFLRHAWSFGGSPDYALGNGDVALSTLLSMLGTGVELFFVLSGFLVARRFVAAAELGQPRPSLRRYARDRVFRIVPLYWVILVL
ncbi:MAG: acyltransferase family protein, partial [Ilumatobacteraceae bacterium]